MWKILKNNVIQNWKSQKSDLSVWWPLQVDRGTATILRPWPLDHWMVNSIGRKLKNLMTGINYYIVHMKIVYHQPATQQITGLTSTPSFLWNTCHQLFTGCLHICSYGVSVMKSNICMHLLESFNKGLCSFETSPKKGVNSCESNANVKHFNHICDIYTHTWK